MLAQAASQSGWVPYLLFESPGWLLVVLALMWAGTRIIGRRTGNKRVMHLSWIALGLIAIVFATSHFVTTQREELLIALEELLDAVEDKQFDAVRTLVDDEAMVQFMDDELTREQMIDRVDAVEFDDIILLTHYSELDGKSGYGRTIFRVNAKGTVNDFPGVKVSEWVIRWRHVDGRWVAVRLECIEMGGIEELY